MKKFLIKSVLISSLFITGLSHASTPKINWKLKDAPSTGVSELHFPMSFLSTPDASGVYFAYYVSSNTGSSRPYTGFQPKPPRIPGKHTFQAIFSSFSNKAKHNDSQCTYGADGGAGVSCSVQFEAELNRFYSIRLKATRKDSDLYYYSGEVYDDSTNKQVAHIGSFTIPLSSGAGLFRIWDQGFIEPYLGSGCKQTISAKYGQVTGYLNGKKYVGNAITGSTPASGSCIDAMFTPSEKTKITDVEVKPSKKVFSRWELEK